MSDAVPPLVARALALAAHLGFEHSCIPEVGRLLAVLAAGRPRGRTAEIGTGAGVGSAWIASALPAGAILTTVEVDSRLADAATALFANTPNVEVLVGDWRIVLPARAPLDLVFLDGGDCKHSPHGELPDALALLGAGGVLVLDDLTPERPGPDPLREFVADRADLVATEILTTATTAAIVAAKR